MNRKVDANWKSTEGMSRTIVLGIVAFVVLFLLVFFAVLKKENRQQKPGSPTAVVEHPRTEPHKPMGADRERVPDVIAPAAIQSLERGLREFLDAGSSREKALIASRMVRAVALEPDAERVELDLAELTGALIGASGDGAPEVAAALVEAAGTNHGDTVAAAITIATSVGENPNAAQAIVAIPDSSIDENFRETVLNAARSFKMIQANWDPVQSKPIRDLFMDSDGGEKSYLRGVDLQNNSEEK